MSTDILLVGATGYTGRLISEYLSSHPDRQSHNLKLTLVGRSHSKLTHLFNSLPSKTNISILVVSSLSSESLNLQNTFLVINTVGPYFSLSPTLAHQCALSSTHYLDLSGEPHQLFSLIQKYNTHGSALSSRALIIPSCGYDSIPSDLSSYLSAKALFDSGKQPGKSTTVHSIGGSLSGGTIATALSTFSIPRSFLKLSTRPFASSPIVGPKPFPKPQLIYNLSIPGFTSYIGSFFPMSSPNISVVQRSYGLLELDHIENPTSPNFHYGSKFTYDEFLKVQSRLTAFLYSSTIFTCMILLFFKPVSPFHFLPKPTNHPSNSSVCSPHSFFHPKAPVPQKNLSLMVTSKPPTSPSPRTPSHSQRPP